MVLIDASQLEKHLSFQVLVNLLKEAFQSTVTAPLRHHHDFHGGRGSDLSTLLLMPAWESGKYLGIKIVVISPLNTQINLPTIQGQYLLFDAQTGALLAQMDARMLTNLRTAAASALASTFLSRKSSHSLLLLGTGALAPYLIKAHTSVRPIQKVWVWGRRFSRASKIAQQFANSPVEVEPVQDFHPFIHQADIISTATLSTQPLIWGKDLTSGQHLDLVGAFKPNLRECDSECLQKASVFVDTLEGAPSESGDLAQPIAAGHFDIDRIKGDLFDLCRKNISGRTHEKEITLFESVGHALEDLAAAVGAYEKLA